MKINFYLLNTFMLFSQLLNAQIGINTSNVNSNTLLHISEKDDNNNIFKKGIMIPRLTNSEKDELTYIDHLAASKVFKLSNSEHGLLFFNTTENCFNYWNGPDSSWKSLCGNLGPAEYGGIDCAEIRINGNYITSKEVNNTHFMTISNISVTKPGYYSLTIESSTNNGYLFKGEGSFSTIGNHTIKLYAQGTPVTVQVDTFILDSSLSNNNNDCSVTVQVQNGSNNGYDDGDFISLPSLTYLSIANSLNEGYSWGADVPGRLEAMRAPTNFGPNGVVKMNWFKPFIAPYDPSTTVTPFIGYLNPVNATTLLSTELAKADNDPTRKLPDIIFYSAYATRSTNSNLVDDLIPELINYVNKGGVLIYTTKDRDIAHANALIGGLFGQQYATATESTSDNDIYPINNLTNDPIINGYFGNSAGEYWGEDNKHTIFINNLPPNSVQIASANGLNSTTNNDTTSSVVWYNKSKNFFYFGDTVGTGASESTSIYPSHFVGNSPIPKLHGNPKKRNIYNSTLEMNAIVWAAKKALTSGINRH